jgi:hypothetical protein
MGSLTILECEGEDDSTRENYGILRAGDWVLLLEQLARGFGLLERRRS